MTIPSATPVTVSAVVPVYAGEAYIDRLVEAFSALRARWESESVGIRLGEVIFVDDDAVDGSPDLLDALAVQHSWVSVFHLSRNFGQHAATIAGIRESTGEWVATLDEDLQHPPERIPQLLAAAVAARADVVYAQPSARVHEAAVRDLTSRGYKRLVERLTGNYHIRYVNSFRVIRGSVARAAAEVCGHDTFFDVALSWFTRRVQVVTMDLKDSRYITTGQSGYRLHTLLSHARRLLVTSQLKVLRIGALLGFCVVGLSLFGGIGLLLVRLLAPEAIGVAGWTSLMLVNAFFGGLILLLVGILLEYVSLLVMRAHGRPLYCTVDRESDTLIQAQLDRRPDRAKASAAESPEA